MRNCKYVTICSVLILYEIKMENNFFCQIGNSFVWNWGKKTYILALGMGAEFWPQNRVIKSPGVGLKNKSHIFESGRGVRGSSPEKKK